MNYLRNWIFCWFNPNIYFPCCCLLLRIEIYLDLILKYIILVQDTIQTYICLQQV